MINRVLSGISLHDLCLIVAIFSEAMTSKFFRIFSPFHHLVHGPDHVNRRILRRLARQFKIHHLPFTVPNPENIAGVQVFSRHRKRPETLPAKIPRTCQPACSKDRNHIPRKHTETSTCRQGREVQMLRTGTEKKLCPDPSLERVFSFKQIIIGQAFGISESSIHFASVFIHLETSTKNPGQMFSLPGSQRK